MNHILVPMESANEMVLQTLEADVLRPEIVLGAVRKALDRLRVPERVRTAQRDALEKSIATVEAELSRYTEAVATAGPLPTILSALQEREARRASLQRELARLDYVDKLSVVDALRLSDELQAQLRLYWKDMLLKHSAQARQLLRKLLPEQERIQFIPQNIDGKRVYKFRGRAVADKILSGSVQLQKRWRPQRVHPKVGTDSGHLLMCRR